LCESTLQAVRCIARLVIVDSADGGEHAAIGIRFTITNNFCELERVRQTIARSDFTRVDFTRTRDAVAAE
jgi:hypothetical protein